MLYFIFDFPGRRYHATPWGHHVNEGIVEWPPSPWRIIRALLATGYAKLGWKEFPDEMRQLLEALAASEPSYRLPSATRGHTRHYMPVKGWKKGVQATSLVIDAFVRPEGKLGIEWPVDLSPGQRDLLARLLHHLGYLGRAESRVKASLVSDPVELPAGMLVSTRKQNEEAEPMRLLAPISGSAYQAWREGVPDAPDDLVAALHVETSDLQKHRWSAPPGSRELVYWLPARAVLSAMSSTASHIAEIPAADTALFALATDRKRDVLPLMERALPTMELFRRALLSKVGDDQLRGQCPELTGKDESGQPLHNRRHDHAHFIPLSLDERNRGRIDHVLVYAPMGFRAIAQRALRSIRKTWAKGLDDIAVTLVGLGSRESFIEGRGRAIPELAESTTWVSRTPFIPPRFLKAHGENSLEGQVRAELRRRGLPAVIGHPIITLRTNQQPANEEGLRRFRHFVRRRREDNKPQPPPGLFHLTLTFDSPISGPLCLGWGSHFGLGLFVSVSRNHAQS